MFLRAEDVRSSSRFAAFHPIHRLICGVDEFVDALPLIRINADADAGSNRNFTAIGLQHDGKQGHHLFGDAHGIVDACGTFDQDDELIAAEAGDGVLVAQDAAQAAGNITQDGVAGPVAELVVDRFEVVEVDEQDGETAVLALAAFEAVLGAGIEQQAVRQPGQRVVVGQIQQLGRRLPGRGDVAQDADHAQYLAGVVAHHTDG